MYCEMQFSLLCSLIYFFNLPSSCFKLCKPEMWKYYMKSHDCMTWSPKKNYHYCGKKYWNVEELMTLSLWHNLHLKKKEKNTVYLTGTLSRQGLK